MSSRCFFTYPLLNNKIPSPPTKGVSDEELNKIKWDVTDKVIKPNDTSPTPSDPFNSSKAPICIDSNYSSNLLRIRDRYEKDKNNCFVK